MSIFIYSHIFKGMKFSGIFDETNPIHRSVWSAVSVNNGLKCYALQQGLPSVLLHAYYPT